MGLLEPQTKGVWVEQSPAWSRENREAEPKSGLQRVGAEAEQVGIQLLPWVAVGRLVRR